MQVLLVDAVELDVLSGRDAQGAVADRVGELVHDQVLIAGEHATGDAGAHHLERIRCLSGLAAGGPGVTVVLGVGAVELEGEDRFGRERRLVVGELVGDRAAKLPARRLGVLDLRAEHVTLRVGGLVDDGTGGHRRTMVVES